MPTSKTIASLGEAGLLRLLHPYCLPNTAGDDAAIQNAPTGRLVVTTDVLVEGVHFSDRTTPPYSVGWRAAAANLSDLAAMGAQPISLVIALGLPSDTPIDWVTQVYDGIADCCRPWGTGLVGGDLSRSPHRFLSITAMGDVLPERVIWRSQAQPGDALVVTGNHGLSRAGLELLLNPQDWPTVPEDVRDAAIAAHQYPKPRLDLLPVLQDIWERGGRIAGMDTSDGLADAVIQVCQASEVGAELERVPMSAEFQGAFLEKAKEWCLSGGEDFELLLAIHPEFAEQYQELAPTCQVIGVVTDSEEITLKGTRIITQTKAFQHWQGKPKSKIET